MAIITDAKFHFNQLMLTLIFGIWASETPGPGKFCKMKTTLFKLQNEFLPKDIGQELLIVRDGPLFFIGGGGGYLFHKKIVRKL